jgi:hypothetical protein
MGKWLVAGAIALVAAMVVLWLQLGSPADATAAAPPPAKAEPAPTVAAQSRASFAAAVKKVEDDKPNGDKMALDSDEFFNAFQDVVVQNASRNAMTCYTGGLHTVHRNAKIKFTVKDTIKNGEVTVGDVQVVTADTTVNDPEMIACMKREIEKTHWHNDRLPDFEEPDMVLIRPEMLVNRWGKEALSYEGSGPDFTKEHPIQSVH